MQNDLCLNLAHIPEHCGSFVKFKTFYRVQCIYKGKTKAGIRNTIQIQIILFRH